MIINRSKKYTTFIYALFVMCITLMFHSSADPSPAFYGLSDPDAEDVKFYGLPKKKIWHAGQRISFEFKAEKLLNAHDFEKKDVTVILERRNVFSLNKRFVMEDLKIERLEGFASKKFRVTARVPKVDKLAKYAVKIVRPKPMIKWRPFKKRTKTIGKTNTWKNFLMFWRVGRVVVSPEQE